MCGGAKQTTKQTSTYTPTAQASQLYGNIIGQATTAAQTPYNPATQQNVAGFTPDQLAAFGAVSDTQGAWTPYTERAGQLFEQSAAPISASAISGYMDPYQQMVVDAAMAQQQRADAIAQNQLKGNAVASGALGGNAPGVAAAQLAGEQGRNRNSMLANLMSGGYSQALAAAQSDAARQAGLGAQFGQLGQMVQEMSLNDIMARLSVGNQQQQQQQTQLDANSANAAAETMWPYQNAQWLASIGAGIGPLTGGTTTGTAKTSQGKGVGNIIGAGLTAASMLSDRRAKEDAKPIGKTFDGQTVYSFRYKGSPKTQIGLMADEVQEHHPEAVGVGPYGMKTVDYDQATNFANGGAVPGSGGAKFFPWAPIVASQPTMPQLSPQSGSSQGQSDPFADPAQAIKLGKGARSGIEDLFRSIDPAGGWGASIEPTSGAGGGGFGLDKIASLFGKGFRDGGDVPGGSYQDPSFIDPGVGSPDAGGIPIDIERARDLMRMLTDAPQIYGDNAFSAGDVMRTASGFANGGSARGLDDVNLAFLSPDVMTPYDLRPDREPPFKDEFIGEVGPPPAEQGSAFDSPDVPMSELPPDIAASNERMRRSFEEAERLAAARSNDPGTMEGFAPPDAVASPYAGTSPQPSPWSFDGGTIRFKGRSFADALAGRDAPFQVPPGAEEMAAAERAAMTPAAFGATVEASPYSDVFPDMTGAMGDTSAPVEQSPGAFEIPSETPAADTTTFDGLGFIRQQEGFKPNAYPDGRQTSIGYGTRGRPGETITREEAERRLQREVGQVDRWIDKNISVKLTPQQRGALQSFGFNLGTDDLDKLKNDINNGDFGRVATRMKSFNKIEKDGKLVPSEGLTARRIREAALMSGGASLPPEDVTTTAGIPDEVQPLVERGMDPKAPTKSKYANADDRAAGGLLKRVFGVDFNPLNLTEDERMAVLTAGLHMMSTGDVGAGGLAGVKYLQGREASDRESAIAAAKLGMDFFKTQSDVDISRERLALEREGKPTDDARNYKLARDEGFTGTFMDFMREKRMLEKGGAEIPAEVAARIGLGRVFMKDAPSIKKEIGTFTAGDRADLVIGRGKAADVWRRIESGREALVRQLTGAGMSQSEAENQARRYQIRADDKAETMIRKVEMLERDLAAVEEGAISGKTGGMSRDWQSGARSSSPSFSVGQRARNPKTGQVIEFTGSGWNEVRP